MISISGDGEREFGRLVVIGVISPPPTLSGRKDTTAEGEEGRELLGLEPELERVTVAGETRGVAERLTDGEGRAERRPLLEAAIAMAAAVIITPPPPPMAQRTDEEGRPGEMVLLLLWLLCGRGRLGDMADEVVVERSGGNPGDMTLRCWRWNCCCGGRPGDMMLRCCCCCCVGRPGEMRLPRCCCCCCGGGSPGEMLLERRPGDSTAAAG